MLIIFGDEYRSYLYPLKPFSCYQGGFITFLMPGPQTSTCSQLRQFFLVLVPFKTGFALQRILFGLDTKFQAFQSMLNGAV